MRKQQPVFQPVLMEIIVILLFFGLAMSVVVQLVAAADRVSRESAFRAKAFLAMETVAEQVKADPEGEGLRADGTRAFSAAPAEGVAVTGNVTRAVESATGGSMYTIVLTASGEGFAPLTLTAYRYLPGEGAAQ